MNEVIRRFASITPVGYKLRWLTVFIFATAMAWVESAVVFYLRTLVGRIVPYQPNPLPMAVGLGEAELIREAATLVMLLAVGMLAGSSLRARLGYAAFAFGVWDIFYYVFLRWMTGWPRSLFDWDILFLLPLPWWGPVLAPVCIALLMIIWGTVASADARGAGWPVNEWKSWALNLLGVVLALYLFMADALKAAPGGADEVRHVLPHDFNWGAFSIALLFMSSPILSAAASLFKTRSGDPATASAASAVIMER